MGRKKKRRLKKRYVNYPEEWRTVSGYEPAYVVRVSSHGRVMILPEKKWDKVGREYVTLCGRDIPVDLLVGLAFVPNPTNSMQPWHINGDIKDSRAKNIRWVEFTRDPAAPHRIYSTLSLLTYILRPSLLAERDKEFTKFYTYLEYLWKTGGMPAETEQLIMDGFDEHKKRIVEDYLNRKFVKDDIAAKLDSLLKEYLNSNNADAVADIEALLKSDLSSEESVRLVDRLYREQLDKMEKELQKRRAAEEALKTDPEAGHRPATTWTNINKFLRDELYMPEPSTLTDSSTDTTDTSTNDSSVLVTEEMISEMRDKVEELSIKKRNYSYSLYYDNPYNPGNPQYNTTEELDMTGVRFSEVMEREINGSGNANANVSNNVNINNISRTSSVNILDMSNTGNTSSDINNVSSSTTDNSNNVNSGIINADIPGSSNNSSSVYNTTDSIYTDSSIGYVNTLDSDRTSSHNSSDNNSNTTDISTNCINGSDIDNHISGNGKTSADFDNIVSNTDNPSLRNNLADSVEFNSGNPDTDSAIYKDSYSSMENCNGSDSVNPDSNSNDGISDEYVNLNPYNNGLPFSNSEDISAEMIEEDAFVYKNIKEAEEALYQHIPEDLFASALVELYDRCVHRAIKHPNKVWRSGYYCPIPSTAMGAMRRVINDGGYQTGLTIHNIRHATTKIKSDQEGMVYMGGTTLHPATLLGESLTAPYHLNMVPQLPSIKKEEYLEPTHHLQSMLYELKMTGKFPEWAEESLTEVIAKMLEDKLSGNDSSPVNPNNGSSNNRGSIRMPGKVDLGQGVNKGMRIESEGSQVRELYNKNRRVRYKYGEKKEVDSSAMKEILGIDNEDSDSGNVNNGGSSYSGGKPNGKSSAAGAINRHKDLSSSENEEMIDSVYIGNDNSGLGLKHSDNSNNNDNRTSTEEELDSDYIPDINEEYSYDDLINGDNDMLDMEEFTSSDKDSSNSNNHANSTSANNTNKRTGRFSSEEEREFYEEYGEYGMSSTDADNYINRNSQSDSESTNKTISTGDYWDDAYDPVIVSVKKIDSGETLENSSNGKNESEHSRYYNSINNGEYEDYYGDSSERDIETNSDNVNPDETIEEDDPDIAGIPLDIDSGAVTSENFHIMKKVLNKRVKLKVDKGECYVGNNRNSGSIFNRDVHPNRKRIFTDNEIKSRIMPRAVNSYPEYDIKGRPMFDENMFMIRYNEPEIDLGMGGEYVHNTGYRLGMGVAKSAVRQIEDFITMYKNYKGLVVDKKEPEKISPLYDPRRDITLGFVNTRAGLEESSYYNQFGQKVYHNVRYGERYDPERHTLYIPEIQAMPVPFNVTLQKRNYLDDYVKYLQKHYPEIGEPELMLKYYETAKSVRNIMTNVLPNCPKNVIRKKFQKNIPVRAWLPDGECMVFDTMKQASEATGCKPQNIYACCEGDRKSIYGIRWEYVDLADMDLMINRYLKKIMKVVEDCQLEVDWEEFIDSGVLKRMDDTISYYRKSILGYRDVKTNVLIDNIPEYWMNKMRERKAERYAAWKIARGEVVDPEREIPVDKEEPRVVEELYPLDNLPEDSPWISNRDITGIPFGDSAYALYRMKEDAQKVKVEERRISDKEAQVDRLRERLREQSQKLNDSQKELDRRKEEFEAEVQEKYDDMQRVKNVVNSKLMNVLDDMLDDPGELSSESDGEENSDKYNSDLCESDNDEEVLKKILSEEHNRIRN